MTVQISPHFLFNPLPALKQLIGENTVQAKSFPVRFSAVLRGSIQVTDQTSG